MLIEVNGQPMLPFFYGLTHSFVGRCSWEPAKQIILRQMAEAGVRLYQVDVYFEDIWHQNQPELDIAYVQKQLGGVLTACPDACIVLRIHVNTPFWWNGAHPEECTGYADGPADWKPKGDEWSHESGDIERAPRPSMASMRWRTEAGQRLQELCVRLAATPEGNSLIGMHVAGGIFGEWHYWGSFKNEPDTGLVMTAHFRNWLAGKYQTDTRLQEAWGADQWTLATATVPDLDERNVTTFGYFRDPARQRRLIDYLECQMEAVADTIEFFCGIVKRCWPRPTLTGIFYGYFHMMFCRTSILGHHCIERILNSPVIDYLSAPQAYWGASRKLGGSGNSRGIIESTALHGKLWLDELDNGAEQTCVDDPKYLPVVRRGAVVPLMRGQGFWYYDFGIGQGSPGWFGGPRNLANIAQEKQLFDRVMVNPRPRQSVSDVLFVWDYDSMYYMPNRWTPISYMQIDQAIEDALRGGAAVDEVYTFDLSRINLDQYRAVVFGNAHCITPEQREFIAAKVAKGGRTVIFNCMPGLTDGQRMGLDLVAQVTGMKLTAADSGEKPAIQWQAGSYLTAFEARMDPFAVIEEPQVEALATLQSTGQVVCARAKAADHALVYATVPILGSSVYRELFRAAGCHLYQEQGEALWANSQHVLLHTATGGQRTLRLRNGKTVRVELNGPTTLLVDAATGEVLLGA